MQRLWPKVETTLRNIRQSSRQPQKRPRQHRKKQPQEQERRKKKPLPLPQKRKRQLPRKQRHHKRKRLNGRLPQKRVYRKRLKITRRRLTRSKSLLCRLMNSTFWEIQKIRGRRQLCQIMKRLHTIQQKQQPLLFQLIRLRRLHLR